MLFLDRYVVFIPPSTTLFGVVMKTKRFTKHRTCETAAAAAAKSANLPNSEDEVRRIPSKLLETTKPERFEMNESINGPESPSSAQIEEPVNEFQFKLRRKCDNEGRIRGKRRER